MIRKGTIRGIDIENNVVGIVVGNVVGIVDQRIALTDRARLLI